MTIGAGELPRIESSWRSVGPAGAIRVFGRRVVGDIIEIGNRLIAVKGRLQHGEWLPWLEQEFGWGETTARKFMAVAEGFGKSSFSADLPIDAGALYLLAGPSVPQVVRGQAVEKAELRGASGDVSVGAFESRPGNLCRGVLSSGARCITGVLDAASAQRKMLFVAADFRHDALR